MTGGPRDGGSVRLDWPGRRAPLARDPATIRQVACLGAGADDADRLILGDNLAVLDALLDDLAGQVQLVYADPPFATGTDYHRAVRLDGTLIGPGAFEQVQYGDRWDEPEYLQFLGDRLPRMRDLLEPAGVLVLHVGGPSAAAARLLGDEVFGSRRLINEVVWVRATAHNDRRQGSRHLGRIHDRLLIWGRRVIGLDTSAAALWTTVGRLGVHHGPPLQLWCARGETLWRVAGPGEMIAAPPGGGDQPGPRLERFAPAGLVQRLRDAGQAMSETGLELVEQVVVGHVDDRGILVVRDDGTAEPDDTLLIVDRAQGAHLHRLDPAVVRSALG